MSQSLVTLVSIVLRRLQEEPPRVAPTRRGDPQQACTRKAGRAALQDRALDYKTLLITRPLLSTSTNGARDMTDLHRPCGNVIQTQSEEVTVS